MVPRFLGRGLGTEKPCPHIIVDANDAQPVLGKAFYGFRTDQAGGTGDDNRAHANQPKLVLCNRYDLPMVEFKMVRRQGATRKHVLFDL